MFSMTDENWRKQNRTVASRLKVILRQEIFTDAIFQVQGKEFKCHRLILAMGSPYFERTFYHTFRNTNSDLPPITKISDVTPEAFQCVLNFLYTDSVTFGNEGQAFETYEAAGKFEIADLKSECEIFLSELDFHPRTIWTNLERASALEMKKVRRKYTSYIQNNTHNCLKDPAFLKASGDIVLQIAQFEKLAMFEVDLVNRLAEWAETKNPKYLKVIMNPYLRHIRFKAMTPKEFCSFTKAHPNIIDSPDSLAILHYLELPFQSSLPSWCCKLSKRIWPES